MTTLFEEASQIEKVFLATLFEEGALRPYAGAGIKDLPNAGVGEIITDGREERRQLEQHSAEF